MTAFFNKLGTDHLFGTSFKLFCASIGNKYSFCAESEGSSVNAVSLKTIQHYAQNALVDRFQEFNNHFGKSELSQKAKEVPLQNIQNVPIAYIFGERDTICPHDRELKYVDKVATSTDVHYVDLTHLDFVGSYQPELREIILT